MDKDLYRMLTRGGTLFHPCLSIDCVVFGFHEEQIKVLLLKMRGSGDWALPGGFIYKEEHVDAAATRILKQRTGLDDVFLRQFQVFGDPARSQPDRSRRFLKVAGVSAGRSHWLLQRFVTVGYYALVEFSVVNPTADSMSEACGWHDLGQLPALIMDHAQILDKALEALRLQLNHQPVGHKLLPVKFSMPELQKLYETILDRKLDRRNFQRRMLGYGILRRLSERRKGGAHKAPYLYSFDLRKYHQALKEGLQGGW
jgi:8-oxo-dGTP diphosphatase